MYITNSTISSYIARSLTNVSMWSRVSLPLFLASFVFGLIAVYVIDEKKRVQVYPTPATADKIQYRDASKQCFTYKLKEVTCPLNPLEVNTVPIQV